jgi:hypothetical protein
MSSFSRNPFVLGGLLLLAVGAADLVVGYRKIREYRQELEAIPPAPPQDPAQLFPRLSAADEKEAILRAKLGYYGTLSTAGRVLILVGVGSCALGVLRARLASARLR